MLGSFQLLSTDAFRRAVSFFWRVFVWLLWAVWWGGLTFYALVVVPIGTELLGSVEQGFVTQRVTLWHNWLGVVLALALAAEAWRLRSSAWICLSIAIAMTTVVLMVWHRHLSLAMNFVDRTVPENFYTEHAIYLWITAVEWLLGMVVAAMLTRVAFSDRLNPSR
ncbi:MAG: hypothetical protein ACK5OB_09735 [Pirellula sp.]